MADIGISRRGLLQAMVLIQSRVKGYITDKKQLLDIFDRASIDIDASANEIVVKVNGSEVIGSEGGQLIFKFDRAGRLIQMVVWNEKMTNQASLKPWVLDV